MSTIFTRQKKHYSCTAIQSLLECLSEHRYENVQVYEGTLGMGNWICIPPDDDHYYFIVKEVALNEWSSAHVYRKCSKLSKENQKLLRKILA